MPAAGCICVGESGGGLQQGERRWPGQRLAGTDAGGRRAEGDTQDAAEGRQAAADSQQTGDSAAGGQGAARPSSWSSGQARPGQAAWPGSARPDGARPNPRASTAATTVENGSQIAHAHAQFWLRCCRRARGRAAGAGAGWRPSAVGVGAAGRRRVQAIYPFHQGGRLPARLYLPTPSLSPRRSGDAIRSGAKPCADDGCAREAERSAGRLLRASQRGMAWRRLGGQAGEQSTPPYVARSRCPPPASGQPARVRGPRAGAAIGDGLHTQPLCLATGGAAGPRRVMTGPARPLPSESEL